MRRPLLSALPAVLVGLRAALGPALVLAAVAGARGGWLVALLALAVLTDVADGILARRLGVATETLRRADSVADTAFYLGALAALGLRAPDAIRQHMVGIGAVLALELVRLGLELRKYGRQAAYHMWSAKLWGLALFAGFTEVFLRGASGPFFQAAIVIGLVADLEGLAASLVLKRWQRDVPSILHAVRERRMSGEPVSG